MGTLARCRRPLRLDQTAIIGRNKSNPFAVSWSCTCCSKWLLTQRTCHHLASIESVESVGLLSPGTSHSVDKDQSPQGGGQPSAISFELWIKHLRLHAGG